MLLFFDRSKCFSAVVTRNTTHRFTLQILSNSMLLQCLTISLWFCSFVKHSSISQLWIFHLEWQYMKNLNSVYFISILDKILDKITQELLLKDLLNQPSLNHQVLTHFKYLKKKHSQKNPLSYSLGLKG